MTSPISHTPIRQHGHVDPPALWKTVILGSVAIHLVGLGLLRLALLGRFQNWRLSQQLIPVEVIALASTANMPTPATQSSPSPIPQKTPAKSSELQQDSAPATHQPTQDFANTTQETPNPSPTKVFSPNSPNPAPTISPTPTISGGTGKTSPAAPTTPNPAPISSSEDTTEPTSPTNQSGGSFIAIINGLSIVSSGGGSTIDPQLHPGDKVATILKKSQPISEDKLTFLGITLEQPVILKVVVLINSVGNAEVIPDTTQVQPGTLSQEQAETLANQILADWRFSPTYMAGKPVDGSYSLTLEINPPAN